MLLLFNINLSKTYRIQRKKIYGLKLYCLHIRHLDSSNWIIVYSLWHPFLHAPQRSSIVNIYPKSEAVRWKREIERRQKCYLIFVGPYCKMKCPLSIPGSSLHAWTTFSLSAKACMQENFPSSYHHHPSETWGASPPSLSICKTL